MLQAGGALRVDLNEAAGADWHFGANDEARIEVDGQTVGTIRLAALHAVREDAAWRRLDDSPCLTSLAEDACRPELAYAKAFPDGLHFEEAKARWASAASRRREEAERVAWSRLDLRTCSAKAAAPLDAHDIARACRPVEAFANEYPTSIHVSEALAAIENGQAVQSRLAEAEARESRQRSRASSRSADTSGQPLRCCDGTLSPTCVVGGNRRGCCSWHRGICG